MSKKDKDTRRWVGAKFENGFSAYMSVKQAIDCLQEAVKAMERGEWKDISIEIRESYGAQELVLLGYRPETEQERKYRERDEAMHKKSRREMYETLKKEFGE